MTKTTRTERTLLNAAYYGPVGMVSNSDMIDYRVNGRFYQIPRAVLADMLRKGWLVVTMASKKLGQGRVEMAAKGRDVYLGK